MTDPVEAAVLGAILLNPAVWPQASLLEPSDFVLRAHHTIFRCMRDLQAEEHPIEILFVRNELARHGKLEEVGGEVYLSSLLEGALDRADISCHVKYLKELAGKRCIALGAEAICHHADKPGTSLSELRRRLAALEHDASQFEIGPRPIRLYEDIPDIMGLEVAPVKWLVEGLIPCKSLILWAGADGTAKTYLAQNMGVSVAIGCPFLGRKCAEWKVLYLDYENPDHEVQARLMKIAGDLVSHLRVWGTWLSQAPPPIGDPVLLRLAREEQPLIIFDPFRYAHSAEENDSTEMMQVMRHLRNYAAAGATVIILHHIAKAEGSSARGSTVIRGAVDIAYVQTLSDDGQITLRCVKNRFGEKPTIVIDAKFEDGQFDVVSRDPEAHRTQDAVITLLKVIKENPGLTQSEIIRRAKINKNRGGDLLGRHTGEYWRREAGRRNAWRYYPLTGIEESEPVPSTDGTGETTGTAVSTP
jgi:hypothetical protein